MSKGLKTKIFEIRNTIGKLIKDKENPFYHSAYFDINSLLDETHGFFETNKLLLTQPIKNGEVYSIIEDLETGDTMESSIPLPNIEDPQKIGSAITYYRRYTLKALLALSEEDDDANKASSKKKPVGKSQYDDKPWLNKTEFKSDKLTEDWKNVTNALSSGKCDMAYVYSKFKVNKDLKAELESIANKNGVPA
ncbi:ERF family protein [Gracilimonas sediminicola]|uniref:ERF family protein n=1 Tax=Gracilimonas sediminicola TaxID=2952158 RepID=A0A9X2REZ7_9BACT|nr:ERF family protein [Gracilimonas sediminicola]MCP9290039.1 ERF family protein [Gracilimonas sediminicola]